MQVDVEPKEAGTQEIPRQEEKVFTHKSFDDLTGDIKDYIETRIEFVKLTALQKASGAAGGAVQGVLLGFFAFLFLIFGLVALGLWFGEMLHSYARGFGLLVGILLVILILLVVLRKAIHNMVQNTIIKKYFAAQRDKEAADNGKK